MYAIHNPFASFSAYFFIGGMPEVRDGEGGTLAFSVHSVGCLSVRSAVKGCLPDTIVSK